MAKQSGIHQIRGKIEGRSYYRQSGVDTGLSRSINQGLSARVKSGDEYINTRKNNAEFGLAADTAKQMGKMVDPKFRPMFLTFSQAKLTTSLLSIIKSASTGTWGQRGLDVRNVAQMSSALQVLAKNDPSLLIGSIVSTNQTGNSTSHEITFAPGAGDILTSWGASGVTVKAARYTAMVGKYIAAESKYSLGALIQHGNSESVDVSLPITGGTTETIELSDGNKMPPADPTKEPIPFDVFVVMPFRTVNGTDSILQEHCTFIVREHDQE